MPASTAIKKVADGIGGVFNRIKGIYGGPAFRQARAIGRQQMKAVRQTYGTGGFAMKAGVLGAAGGGVGYWYSDGDMSAALKGAGLGVLGAAAHQGFRDFRTGGAISRQIKGLGGAVERRVARAERIAGRAKTPASVAEAAMPAMPTPDELMAPKIAEMNALHAAAVDEIRAPMREARAQADALFDKNVAELNAMNSGDMGRARSRNRRADRARRRKMGM